MAAKAAAAELLDIDGREVRVTNPHKVYFPVAGVTKLDLVNYYLAVADAALGAIGRRPLVLKRYVNGIEGEGFYQKRAPAKRPDWVRTVELTFPSGRTAHELVISERAQLVWITNLGNIDLHPHPVREDDLDHPDELRIDLDPGPGVPWQTVREVAQIVREVLAEQGPDRLAQDHRLARPARLRPAAHGALAKCAGRRWRCPAKWSGAHPAWRPASGGRRSGWACFWITTRTPRIARSRPPTRCARCRRRAYPLPWPGTRCPSATPPTSRFARSRAGLPNGAIWRRASMRAPAA